MIHTKALSQQHSGRGIRASRTERKREFLLNNLLQVLVFSHSKFDTFSQNEKKPISVLHYTSILKAWSLYDLERRTEEWERKAPEASCRHSLKRQHLPQTRSTRVSTILEMNTSLKPWSLADSGDETARGSEVLLVNLHLLKPQGHSSPGLPLLFLSPFAYSLGNSLFCLDFVWLNHSLLTP